MLRNNLIKSIELLENKHYPLGNRRNVQIQDIFINHNNQLLILKQYIKKADRLLNQLFPKIQIDRQKRSLIEGLGTVIKFITGNLSADDGRRYESIISKLKHETETHKNILLEQAQILNDTISTVHDLSENQKLLNNNLNKIFLDNVKIHRILTEASTYSVIDESIQSLQLFINVWTELEIALTFAQKQQLHLSLIDNNELIQSLTQISESLNKLQPYNNKNLDLPYPPNYENLHLYESIITTKIYQKDNIFTFIFEIPLVKPFLEYQLIKLIPFPAYTKNNKFQMIIPSYNTILYNKEFSVPIEFNNCQITSINHYFCSHDNHFNIPNSKLCETQLLSFHENQTCEPYIFELITDKILQIDTASWLVSSPSKTILDIKCKNNIERKDIRETNLIHLTPDCSVLINHNELLFAMKSSSTKEIELKLPSVGELQIYKSKIINVSKMDLTSTNTQDLVKTKIKLNEQRPLTDLVRKLVDFCSHFWKAMLLLGKKSEPNVLNSIEIMSRAIYFTVVNNLKIVISEKRGIYRCKL
ncbi:hypothetical protein FQR65_LT04543 [Abscondita terminalis]|nr:hypothetical protein FQR65_LT04543 [Abscondita terminalis]